MFKNTITIILLTTWLGLMAQVNYTDYQNPFPQTYLGFGNSLGNTALFDNGSFFMAGGIIFSFKQHSLLFKKTLNNPTFKIYSASPQTTLESVILSQNLLHYYSFTSTDATIGCTSAGLKVLKIDKNNLSLVDSVFFCDPAKPSSGQGYFIHNHFYTHSAYEQYYPLPANYIKKWNLIRCIDTNLIMLNEQILGDTSEIFSIYSMREGCDGGIIANALNETKYCPMLIKLDTMGVEQWRKNYYTIQQTGGCGTNANNGIMGLQNYQNGYIALFNASNAGSCPSYYSRSIIAKIDKDGNIVKEMQYSSNGDTLLEFNSNINNYQHRAFFKNILIKTIDGNFASVISEKERYGWATPKNYIVILDTNLNIIHRSPELGEINNSLNYPGMIQGTDSVFYLGGGVMNASNDGMNVRVYTYKIGGQVGVMEYKNEQQFKIYPNPAIHELNIELDEEPQLIRIHNSMGQLVYSQTHHGSIKINLNNWSKGVYFVELRNTKTGTKQSQKIIVE
jgi:hypothetical protein